MVSMRKHKKNRGYFYGKRGIAASKALLVVAILLVSITAGIFAIRSFAIRHRNDFIRLILAPQESKDEWSRILDAQQVQIYGGTEGGYVLMWQGAPNNRWWQYTYTTAEKMWPQECTLPPYILDKAIIKAAADIEYGDPVPGMTEKVVSGYLEFSESEAVDLLLESGWANVASEHERLDREAESKGLKPLPSVNSEEDKHSYIPQIDNGQGLKQEGIYFIEKEDYRTDFRWTIIDMSTIALP